VDKFKTTCAKFPQGIVCQKSLKIGSLLTQLFRQENGRLCDTGQLD